MTEEIVKERMDLRMARTRFDENLKEVRDFLERIYDDVGNFRINYCSELKKKFSWINTEDIKLINQNSDLNIKYNIIDKNKLQGSNFDIINTRPEVSVLNVDSKLGPYELLNIYPVGRDGSFKPNIIYLINKVKVSFIEERVLEVLRLKHMPNFKSILLFDTEKKVVNFRLSGKNVSLTGINRLNLISEFGDDLIDVYCQSHRIIVRLNSELVRYKFSWEKYLRT